jgi:hypothetical protein
MICLLGPGRKSGHPRSSLRVLPDFPQLRRLLLSRIGSRILHVPVAVTAAAPAIG